MSKTALIVVDVQRDFCEGGALSAADTMSLLTPLQDCIGAARRAGALIVFTQAGLAPGEPQFVSAQWRALAGALCGGQRGS